jgi:hypothetical protein
LVVKLVGSEVGEKGGCEGVVGREGEGDAGCEEREGGEESEEGEIEGRPVDPKFKSVPDETVSS